MESTSTCGTGAAPHRQGDSMSDQPSETSECIAIVKWALSVDLEIVHVPNGMGRSKIEGNLLKKMGLRPGFPDYFIPQSPKYAPHSMDLSRIRVDRKSTAFEMKKRDGSDPTKRQKAWLDYLTCNNWLCGAFFGAQQAVHFLSAAYDKPLPTGEIITSFPCLDWRPQAPR